MEKAPHLDRLFSPEIFGRLPSSGRARVRRTALGVIGQWRSLSDVRCTGLSSLRISGSYSSWFASHPSASSESNLLLTVLGYVVSALPDPSLSLPAATALRNLCEANRKALAPHIGAFGELHAALNTIPVGPLLASTKPADLVFVNQDTEKGKVLQSIASVIQAMPPADEIPVIEVSIKSQ